jgi:uncharacterized delta-60 repeat protein
MLPRRIFVTIVIVALTLSSAVIAIAQTPLSLAQSQVIVLGTINAIAVQSDGKVVLGGAFTKVGDHDRSNLARLNAEGSVDAAWAPDVYGGPVNAIAIDPADNIYIGGEFSYVGESPKAGLARIPASAAGTADGWQPYLGTVNSIALDHAGNLFAAGTLYLQNLNIAKVPTTGYGEIDSTWAPAPIGRVWGVAIDASDNLFAIGDFFQIGGVTRFGLVKLSTAGSGTVDVAWNPSPDALASALSLDGAGWLYLGGTFSSVGGSPRRCVARVSTSGTGEVDPGWIPNAFSDPMAPACYGLSMAFDGNGSLYLNATIQSDTGENSFFVERIGADGVVDAMWPTAQKIDRGFGLALAGTQLYGSNFAIDTTTGEPVVQPVLATWPGYVYALARDSQGRLVIGGWFDLMGDGSIHHNLVRLRADGSVDSTWAPEPDNVVYALAVDQHDDVYATGAFRRVGADPRFHLAKISGSGSGLAVPGWHVDLNSQGQALAVDGAGNLFVGGLFSQVGGLERHALAKISPGGIVDPNWQPEGTETFSSVSALATDGVTWLYAGGRFASIGGQARINLARLALGGSGAVDPLWDPGLSPPGSSVRALALDDANVRLYVGTTFGGVRLARVSTKGTGAVDSAWIPKVTDDVQALALGPDNTIYVGVRALLPVYGTVYQGSVLRIFLDGPGKVYAGWYAALGDSVNAVLADPIEGFHAGGRFCVIPTIDGVFRRCGYVHMSSRPSRPATLDPDGNGRYDALTDGLILLRYLFGLRGSSLIAGAIGPNASETDSAAIGQHLSESVAFLDVDYNGTVDALTDGLMIVRYLFGVRGHALINGALGAGARRTDVQEIEDVIESMLR